MPLSEEQIQRYSRQILLLGVGGVGQAKLLAGAVELTGAGAALDTAAAYLAAGGCPVRRDGRWVGEGIEGGGPDRDPGAAAQVALLGAGGTAPPAGLAVVRIDPERLVYRSAGACEVCFRALEAEGPPPRGARATLAGTLAALLCQALILGTLSGVGSLALDGERALTAEPAPPCAACGGPR